MVDELCVVEELLEPEVEDEEAFEVDVEMEEVDE